MNNSVEHKNSKNLINNSEQLTIIQLPDIIIENILKFLSYNEVAKLRETCQCLYRICNRYIRIGLKKIRYKINNEMKLTAQQIAYLNAFSDIETILKRAPFFRKYNRLELLLTELNIISVLCRHIINKKNICFPGGLLMDAFLAYFNKVMNDSHETWSVMDFTCGNLQMKVRMFLNQFHINTDIPNYIVPIGVQIVDLMDTMLETDYNITITYDLDNLFCEFSGIYEQRKPKFLSYTSQLPRRSCDTPVNSAEMIELVKQLQVIVRIHNELLLRQEQYWREMDIVNLMLQQDEYSTEKLLESNILIKEPRIYNNRIPDETKMLLDNKFQEHYSQTFGPKTRYPRFMVKINLKCLIQNAPLMIQYSFRKLLENLETNTEKIQLKNSTLNKIKSSSTLDAIQTNSTNETNFYGVNAEFHLITPMGLSDEEIEIFEMYWSE